MSHFWSRLINCEVCYFSIKQFLKYFRNFRMYLLRHLLLIIFISQTIQKQDKMYMFSCYLHTYMRLRIYIFHITIYLPVLQLKCGSTARTI